MRCNKASIMLLIRPNSGVSVTSALFLFLLPCGRPGRRLAMAAGDFLAATVALLAAFSASLRTTCSTRTGNARRAWMLTNDKVKKASPGTGKTHLSIALALEALKFGKTVLFTTVWD